MLYNLPPLKYSYDALEPIFSAEMLEIHHGKHHAAYVNKLNELLQNAPYAVPENIYNFIDAIPYASIAKDLHQAVRFNAGGHANHTFFWNILKPYNAKARENTLPTDLEKVIHSTFGNFNTFKEKFTKAALGHLGSGWAWLNVSENNPTELFIATTLNHDHPQMAEARINKTFGLPILTLDLWEHAYYLRYQNRKAEYFDGFWKIVDWEAVAENYRAIIGKL
jgi:Fe-Mn family superoxide dismutase